MTLLAPLKHITALNFSKLSIFVGAASSSLANRRSTPPLLTESADFVEAAPLPPTASEILAQIGAKLRQLREERHLSIEDMSARTQIQPRSIQAIETGDLDLLPEPVYVKGMVKRYGDSLGLDGMAISAQVPTWEPAATTFESATKLQATGFGSQTTGFNSQTTGFGSQTTGFNRQVTGFSSQAADLSDRTSGFSHPIKINPLCVYLGYMLAILTIGAGTSRLLNNAVKPQSIPIRADVIQPVVPTGAKTQLLPTQGVRVGIVIKDAIWAQIGVDGTTKFTGNLKAGMQLSWIANKQVTISTNNAGGILLSRDAQPLQPLGKVGQKQHVTIKVGK